MRGRDSSARAAAGGRSGSGSGSESGKEHRLQGVYMCVGVWLTFMAGAAKQKCARAVLRAGSGSRCGGENKLPGRDASVADFTLLRPAEGGPGEQGLGHAEASDGSEARRGRLCDGRRAGGCYVLSPVQVQAGRIQCCVVVGRRWQEAQSNRQK